MEAKTMQIDVVVGGSAHAPAIDHLLRQLADSEGTSADLTYELEDLTDALAKGFVHSLVASIDGNVVGCLTFTWDFAIWSGGRVMRIDDLIVDESRRGHGIGTRLMLAAALLATSEGTTVRWEVESRNAGAQRFYRRLGADLKPKVVARWSIESMCDALGRKAAPQS